MRIRLTKGALADLDEILEYIDAQSGQGAANTKRRILEVIAPLKPQNWYSDGREWDQNA